MDNLFIRREIELDIVGEPKKGCAELGPDVVLVRFDYCNALFSGRVLKQGDQPQARIRVAVPILERCDIMNRIALRGDA